VAKVSLAELAHRVDVPRSTVHAYVSGLTLPPAEVLDRLVIALGADATEQAEWAESWFRVASRVDRQRRGGGRPTTEPAAPRQIPPGVPAFTGRAEQLAELDRRLAAGGAPVLVSAIAGTAGVGKPNPPNVTHWSERPCCGRPSGRWCSARHRLRPGLTRAVRYRHRSEPCGGTAGDRSPGGHRLRQSRL